MNHLADVLAAVRISVVYTALTGIRPKHGRGIATWRQGKQLSVALADPKGTWYDHAAGEGGGVLDLIVRVLGYSRQDALSWLAAFAGIPLDGLSVSPAERQRYMREKRLHDRDLPMAQLWRRAAVSMAEQVLSDLKAQLLDLKSEIEDPRPLVAEIQALEGRLERWHRSNDGALVEAYRAFLRANPRLTSAMLRAVWRRHRAEEKAARRAILGEIE